MRVKICMCISATFTIWGTVRGLEKKTKLKINVFTWYLLFTHNNARTFLHWIKYLIVHYHSKWLINRMQIIIIVERTVFTEHDTRQFDWARPNGIWRVLQRISIRRNIFIVRIIKYFKFTNVIKYLFSHLHREIFTNLLSAKMWCVSILQTIW